jgi:hypothetical protein
VAREYARLRVGIWEDGDFRALGVDAQHLYITLLTGSSLSLCGVADWRPGRIAAYVRDWDAARVIEAGCELVAAAYLIVDDDTEEVMIRSFLRHDGLMANYKMVVAMLAGYRGVASASIRAAIQHELGRLQRDEPGLTCWSAKATAGRLAEIVGMPSRSHASPADQRTETPIGTPIGLPIEIRPDTQPDAQPDRQSQAQSDRRSDAQPDPQADPPAPNSLLLTPNYQEPQLPSSTAVDGPTSDEPKRPSRASIVRAGFAEFWHAYPSKIGKAAAERKFDIAIRKIGAEPTEAIAVLVAAAGRYRDDPTRKPDFTAHPETWLNKGRWEDAAPTGSAARPRQEPTQW